MTEPLPSYELFAIQYARRDATRAEHFVGGDPHDGPMPMAYYSWVAVGTERVFVIDTGFSAEVAARRQREFLRCPVETLRRIGIDPAMVGDVILTHLHNDHAGSATLFPRAEFHLQEPEMHFATRRYMRYARLSKSFECDHVCDMVRLNFDRRVNLYRGDRELAPGITVHLAGGHSAGLQFVRVHTRRGWVVVASDVTHFYENMESGRPFSTAFHVGEMLEGFDKLRAAAPSEDHIVPGHDPLVMERYPAPSPELEGVVARLDVAPKRRIPEANGAARIANGHGQPHAVPAKPDAIEGRTRVAEVLLSADHGRARLLTMNRPDKMNALNRDLMVAVTEAVLAADQNTGIGAVVLAGAGRAFCAGADLDDLKILTSQPAAAMEAHADVTFRFFAVFNQIAKPVIAAVNGYALGGGNGLALACDMVLAGDTAQFGFPEVRNGTLAALVMAHVVRQLGRKAAFELVATGDRIDAAKALQLGMINRVVPADTVVDEAVAAAARIASYEPLAVAATKKLFHRVADLSLSDALQVSRDANFIMRQRREKAKAGQAGKAVA